MGTEAARRLARLDRLGLRAAPARARPTVRAGSGSFRSSATAAPRPASSSRTAARRAQARQRRLPPARVEVRIADDGETWCAARRSRWLLVAARRDRCRVQQDGGSAAATSARLDARTGLAITGRSKEMIISGGLNVFPREVEAALEDHPAVSGSPWSACRPSAGGRRSWPSSSRGVLDPEELIAHCRERLSGYKCPKRVLVVDGLRTTEWGRCGATSSPSRRAATRRGSKEERWTRTEGSVVFITGGSKGIGLASAKMLVEEGCRVAITARDGGRGGAGGRGARRAGGRGTRRPGDMTRTEDVERAVAETLDRFGRIDVLVTCAGARRAACSRTSPRSSGSPASTSSSWATCAPAAR